MSDPAAAERRLPDPVDDGHCIACGLLSPIGLKMRFETLDDGSVQSRVAVGERFQGWRGVVHGGIVAVLLDEAMAYAAAARGHKGVTAELKMRFRQAVAVGNELVVRGKVTWQRRNVFGVEASVSDSAGAVLATGTGGFVSRGRLAAGERLGEVRAAGL